MPRFFVDLWRTFKRLLGEEHWEFVLLVDREEFLKSLREQISAVPRWRALSPGCARLNAQFYGHVGKREIVLRVRPTRTNPWRFVVMPITYAYVGRIVDDPRGFTLIGDYRVVPIIRQFVMLCFGFLLLTVLIAVVSTAELTMERQPDAALRGGAVLLGCIFFAALLRILVWIPESRESTSRKNLRRSLANLAAGEFGVQ